MATETTGQRLRRLREDRGMSQRELATACDCDQNTISRLERDLRAPSSGVAQRISKVLGVSVDDLLGEQAA